MTSQRTSEYSGEAGQPRSGESPLLLTVAEAARLLHIGRNTCYELIRRGELPAVRLGERIIRVPRPGLEGWLARQAGLPELLAPVVDSPHRRTQGTSLTH